MPQLIHEYMNDFWSVVSEKRSKNWKKLHKITHNSIKIGVAP